MMMNIREREAFEIINNHRSSIIDHRSAGNQAKIARINSYVEEIKKVLEPLFNFVELEYRVEPPRDIAGSGAGLYLQITHRERKWWEFGTKQLILFLDYSFLENNNHCNVETIFKYESNRTLNLSKQLSIAEFLVYAVRKLQIKETQSENPSLAHLEQLFGDE